MHGLILEDNKIKGVKNIVLSANVEISIPKVPGKPFLDLALVEGLEPYFDCGIKKSFGPLVIIIPLYQNWNDSPYVTDTDWLLDRVRFSLDISFNIQNMF